MMEIGGSGRKGDMDHGPDVRDHGDRWMILRFKGGRRGR